MNNTHTEKEPRLNITSILIEEESLCTKLQQSGVPLEQAKSMALSNIKHKYSQYDL